MATDIIIGLTYLSAAAAFACFAWKHSGRGRLTACVCFLLILICSLLHLYPGILLLVPHARDYRTGGLLAFIPALAVVLAACMAWRRAGWDAESGEIARQSMGELEETVGRLKHEIVERARAESELQRSQELLRQLAAYQEQVKEDERKRIAREIHDELGQNLMALRIDVSLLQARTARTHPLLNEKVEFALQHIDATIKAVRAIINNLRPSVLDLGLYAAIEWQVNEFKRRTGLQCEVIMDENESDFELDDQRATALFRILQESLTNVARHAQASQVRVELQKKTESLQMTIMDDGVGIFPGCRRKPNSFGLLGIGERISMLGGQFSVDSKPGEGTVLTISVPLKRQALEEVA